ncbi:MAG TPA: hypothetical protein VMZ25_10880, partial [Terriglobales bacterium]|nr:hypothetical protein [Terriglobales bacterium]
MTEPGGPKEPQDPKDRAPDELKPSNVVNFSGRPPRARGRGSMAEAPDQADIIAISASANGEPLP